MKVKNKYIYDYLSVCLKKTVVVRFRKLCRKLSKPQSETLDAMIDFFEWHGFSPFEKREKSFLNELHKNRKRTEAVIAIIKDIEKNHDKPTTAMLQSLFQGVAEKEEPVRKEKLLREKIKEPEKKTEAIVSQFVHERTELKLKEVRKEFGYVLEHIQLVKNSFGKDYLKLELSQQEYLRIKRELENY
ncbi:BfmA/BtgA family mobilization protein [uncultured Maribacter sp.]|uniref:BfmA/BtgA family mobilization protein n=1 Tax=uncultured Maribacter sp. TaxID=431308 RepID=UPI0026023014|nr:BfmA/BtgA family mobilization protein [uncultured Maribacter sp.]